MSADNWCNCPKCGAVDEFREDYEMGLFDDRPVFFVEYHGRCQKCSFVYTFKIENTLFGS